MPSRSVTQAILEGRGGGGVLRIENLSSSCRPCFDIFMASGAGCLRKSLEQDICQVCTDRVLILSWSVSQTILGEGGS